MGHGSQTGDALKRVAEGMPQVQESPLPLLLEVPVDNPGLGGAALADYAEERAGVPVHHGVLLLPHEVEQLAREEEGGLYGLAKAGDELPPAQAPRE